MIMISESVWPGARAIYEEDLESPVTMLLASTGVHAQVERAVSESIAEVQEQLSGEDTELGEWEWLQLSDGVLLRLGDSLIFEKELCEVAAALGRRGVEGSISLYAPVVGATPPMLDDLLECRVRIRGTRRREDFKTYLWRPDRGAHLAFLAAADQWRLGLRPSEEASVEQGTMAPLAVEPDESLADRLSAAMANNEQIIASSVTGGECRSVSARPYTGGVSLVVSGSAVRGERWARPLDELTAILCEHADLIAYAYIRRGWAVRATLTSDAVPEDWPQRPQPKGSGSTPQAFEEAYAPDSFGLQLLGPGYAGRVPEHGSWQSTPVGSSSTLVAHHDCAAWFKFPFVQPPWDERVEETEHRLLAQARKELAPILYSPGVLSSSGIAKADEEL
jgi:hypothetical protein